MTRFTIYLIFWIGIEITGLATGIEWLAILAVAMLLGGAIYRALTKY